MDKKLSSTMEDYLETISILEKRKGGVARVRDIGSLLDVKSPTVNSAIKTLSEKGFVIHEKYGYVNLTSKGREIAGEIQKRHNILSEFHTYILDVDEKTAAEDACRMEHAISAKTSVRLTKFIEFVGEGLHGENPRWLKNFKHYLKTGKKLHCASHLDIHEKGGKI